MGYFTEALTVAVKLIFTFDQALYFTVFNSLKISLTAVFIAAIFALPLGLSISFNKFIGKDLLQSFLNTLMALPTVVVGLLLYGIFTRNGPLGSLDLLYTSSIMIIGQCILITPVILNLVIAAANNADPRIRLTSNALGANHLQANIIFVREIRFAMMAAIITAFGRAIGEVGIAMMIGGNIQGYTRTMTTAIALETSKGNFEFALALGIFLLVLAFIINYFMQRFQQFSK